MKKTKMFMLVLTSAVLALTPVTASAAEAVPSQVTETVIATPTPTPKKPQKKGWVKTKSGIRRYYRKGKRLTGFQKIGTEIEIILANLLRGRHLHRPCLLRQDG